MSAPLCTCEEVEHFDAHRGTPYYEVVRMDLWCPYHFPAAAAERTATTHEGRTNP